MKPRVALLLWIALAVAVEASAQINLMAMAERGNPEAQYLVGRAYLAGEGVDRDPREAVKWLRFAMRQNHVEARYTLAVMVRDGSGIKARPERAVDLFREGAEAGHAESQLALGEMMAAGRGTPRNDKDAAHWLDEASKQNVPRAQGVLGEMAYDGRGMPVNRAQAYFLLTLAGDAVTPRGRGLREELAKKLGKAKKAEIHGMVRTFRVEHPPRVRPTSTLSRIPLFAEAPAPKAETRTPVLTPEQTAQLEEAERRMPAAVAAGDAKEIAEVARLADGVLAVDGGHPGALRIRAQAHAAAGEPEAARRALRASLERDPNSVDAWLLLGEILTELGDTDGARDALGRVLQIDPRRLEARRALARLEADSGNFASAVTQARLVLDVDAGDTPTLRILVASLLALGRGDEALLALRAIPEPARTAADLVALGQIELERRGPGVARSYFERALASEPYDPPALEGLLAVDTAEGRPAASIARLDAALAAHPDRAALQRLRGMASVAAGRPNAAEPHLERAIEIDPRDAQSYVALARLRAGDGRSEEALRTYERALEASPGDAELHYGRAVLLLSLGRRGEAIASYEAAIAASPAHAQARNELARLLADDPSSLDRALALAEEARGLMPGSPGPAATLGRVHYERGDMLAAIRYLRQAEARYPAATAGRGEVRYLLGRAYVADGDLSQGRVTLEGALADLAAAGDGPEPAWAGDAREVLARLQAAP